MIINLIRLVIQSELVRYNQINIIEQDVFIKIGKGEGAGELKETLYKMDKVEANLLKNFLYGRNNMQLFAKVLALV